MNQRVPDSSGLPLRAMVMVLLFLAVVFLLLGIYAVSSGDDSSNQATPAVTTPTTTTTTSPPAPAKTPVFVYNISDVDGLADQTGQRLDPARWNVTVSRDRPEVSDVTTTTVFYTEVPGEKESADEVAKILDDAPVELRRDDLVGLPPGVIVVVTG